MIEQGDGEAPDPRESPSSFHGESAQDVARRLVIETRIDGPEIRALRENGLQKTLVHGAVSPRANYLSRHPLRLMTVPFC